MKISKKLIAIACLSLIAVAGIGVGSYFIYKHLSSNPAGTISVEIIQLDGTKTNEKSISYNEGDTLVPLLESNFDNVVVENGILMSIDNLTTPSDWSTFICIYVDNVMSDVLIQDIQFKDGTVISFVDTVYDENY